MDLTFLRLIYNKLILMDHHSEKKELETKIKIF